MPAEQHAPPYDTFLFTRRAVEGRRVRIGYALTGPRGARLDFEETLDLPTSLGPLRTADDPAVSRALLGLHLAGGTSYWKTCVPSTLVIDGAELTADDAAFWTEVYTKGMAEFFYRNGIDPTGRAWFPATGAGAAPAPAPHCDAPPLLLWGGGKDSVVSHEALALAGEGHDLLTVGRSRWEWTRRAAERAGRPLHVIERRLDPRLLELNAAGAWNGHVPVSAFLAFAGTLAALLTGHRAVIASNESSASFGNATWRGVDVNHQWSKSLEFERLFGAWRTRHLAGGPDYFSLLRPLTELRIVASFASHPAYFSSVTSCNRNFTQAGAAGSRWCRACPKCVFVSLMARPWLDDGAYHALFEGDALADPANADTVAELLGVRGTKPFECVGTPDETLAAFHLARTRGARLPHGCMTLFNERVASERPDLEAVASRALARSDDHALSERWLAILDGYLDRR